MTSLREAVGREMKVRAIGAEANISAISLLVFNRE